MKCLSKLIKGEWVDINDKRVSIEEMENLPTEVNTYFKMNANDR